MVASADYGIFEPANTAVGLRSDLVFTPDTASQPPCYVIEDQLRGKFYRVGLREFALLSALDGRATISEAVGRAAERLGPNALSVEEALTICRWLVQCQLATRADGQQPPPRPRTESDVRRTRLRDINPLAIRLPVANPDALLARCLPAVGWLLTWPAAIGWLVLAAWAVWRLADRWNAFAEAAAVIFGPAHWPLMMLAWMLLKIVHEAGHGLACKKYGGNVGSAGVFLILLAPAAFVDVTSAWRFRRKWPRVVTAAAGVYFEMLVASIAALLWTVSPHGLFGRMCLDLAIMGSLNTLLFNANPLVRYDAYFILSDLLAIPNLFSAGQGWLEDGLRRNVLGWKTPRPDWSRGRRLIVAVYGLASSAWRLLFFVTMAAVLVATLGGLGGLLAAAMFLAAYAMPLVRLVRRLWHDHALHDTRYGRLALAGSAAFGIMALAALFLLRPGRIAAAAVVDYAPLTVVRARQLGFVREVRVRDGQTVEPGQVLVVLENDDLHVEWADLRAQINQAAIRSHMLLQDKELAKYQVEQSNLTSLEKKYQEIQSQVDQLTIRAAAGGQIVARNLDQIVGQYLQPGTEIAVIGNQQAKELVVAGSQEDLDSLLAQIGRPVQVTLLGLDRVTFTATLTDLRPRANQDLPHAALGAHVGGPIPVRLKAKSDAEKSPAEKGYELVEPCFRGSVAIPIHRAADVSAGVPAMVRFTSTTETTWSRFEKGIQHWFREKLSQQRSAG